MAGPLEHFVEAQARVWPAMVAELEAGSKRTHWMWFVFPQIAGLGHSAMAQRYALASVAEASDYLAHPVLGPRLLLATRLMLGHARRQADTILGPVDALKFRSSMTLFGVAQPEEPMFQAALDAFCAGEADPRTLALIAGAGA